MQQPKFLDRVRADAKARQLSLRTEQGYSDWISLYTRGLNKAGGQSATRWSDKER